MGECQSICTSDINIQKQADMQKMANIEYDGRKFIISDQINFESQATFSKVEQAARAFCQKNNISLFHIPLVSRIIAYRHQFIFEEIWNRMSETERGEFLEDLNSISHDLMDSFYFHFVIKRLRSNENLQKVKYVYPPKLTKQDQISQPEKLALIRYGQDLMRQGKIAVVFMCAGSSSRFQGQDKFLAPFMLGQKQYTMLDFMFVRLRRNAAGNKNVPIIINCNEQNISKLQSYLREKHHFGFNPSKFRFATTYSLAVFDQNGKYCLSDKMRLIKKPSGTAACAESLLSPAISKFLQHEGTEYIYFGGMENLLESPAHPLFLGVMWCEKRKCGVKCVNPIYDSQAMPRYFSSTEKGTQINLLGSQQINSIPNSPTVAALPVAINSMVFQFKGLTEIVTDYNNNLFLAEKYRVLAKTQQVYNTKTWKLELRSCYSFQKDIRDFLSCVSDPMLFKVDRNIEYAPIRSKNQSYCLGLAVQHFSQRLTMEIQGEL